MQAGLLLLYLVAMGLAWGKLRWPSIGVFVVALVVSAWWLRHHMTDPLAISL
jgi:Family of unknown function (DUF5993)